MNTKSRIASILNTKSLDSSTTHTPAFDLSNLILPTDLDFPLPTNLRLGHLAEKVVSNSITSSSNYNILFENVQVIEDTKTIGEIDFIIEDITREQVIHMELAYKFYLYDPTISSQLINNWIGPNRNDSLVQKLDKLKNKQFPLLHHPGVESILRPLQIENISQALCLLVSLFIPYNYKGSFGANFENGIKGYYLNYETFKSIHEPEKNYYIPAKWEWGMEPSSNENWITLGGLEKHFEQYIQEQKALLCWQRFKGHFSSFFIVGW